jgi:hypothetical protein
MLDDSADRSDEGTVNYEFVVPREYMGGLTGLRYQIAMTATSEPVEMSEGIVGD